MVSVDIYEVSYRGGQLSANDNVTPFRISNENPDWRELQAYLRFYESGGWRSGGFSGLFSGKFHAKAHVDVEAFKYFVMENNNADVCFINPFPQMSYWSYNVWMQGECAHPGLTSAAQALLDIVGLNVSLRELPRHDASNLCYCNFWAAKSHFWNDYVGGWLMPIGAFLKANPCHPVSRQVLSPTFHTDPAPLLPFIVERLFSTYLSLHGDVKAVAWPFSRLDIIERYCLNDFERLLVRELADEIESADEVGQSCFEPALVNKMSFFTKIFQEHFFDYYESRPHPHTGRFVIR